MPFFIEIFLSKSRKIPITMSPESSEKRSQLYTLPSNPIYQSHLCPSTQPCVPIQPSLLPYQTQSHNAYPPLQESHLLSPALQQPSFDVKHFFMSTSGHEMKNITTN